MRREKRRKRASKKGRESDRGRKRQVLEKAESKGGEGDRKEGCSYNFILRKMLLLDSLGERSGISAIKRQSVIKIRLKRGKVFQFSKCQAPCLCHRHCYDELSDKENER